MIVLINPNSTASMTQAMLRTARDAAPDAQFEGWTSHDGPPAIQGEADGRLAAAPLLKLVAEASDRGASAIIIGCFDDTALDAAHKIADCPVVGIGQAAYHFAALTGERFSVVTTLDVSVPILRANIIRYGLDRHLVNVRASGIPVLALEEQSKSASDQVIAEVQTAVREDNVQSVVLGCGGMVDIVQEAARAGPIRLIDGVRAAACFAGQL
ncbi:aspartate/glutamate racemase family protein [Roseobacter sp. YSTF-M11]|uniref:Aspartate/glutamate racemase family protein n=1 Tax=Roseobacter insulae TaxID=2859783 RepID=A0A9X1FW71_9RHOB|nr:aspartate/glutamate racemase family protein [Roseobacter insulae]MBW4708742.1 aspartate/glutamate racemase family protein [Roseobacter insulae]